MKRVLTAEEFSRIEDSVMDGIAKKGVGDPGHTDTHNLIANRINYFPYTLVSSTRKVGENQWEFNVDGEAMVLPDSMLDTQINQMLAYPLATGVAFITVDSSEIAEPLGSSPVGTEVHMYSGGLAMYDAYADRATVDSIQESTEDIKEDIKTTSVMQNKIAALYNRYRFTPNGSSGWKSAGESDPPIQNIAFAYSVQDGIISRTFSFTDDSISGSADLKSIPIRSDDTIEILQYKSYLDRDDFAALDARITDIASRLDALESNN